MTQLLIVLIIIIFIICLPDGKVINFQNNLYTQTVSKPEWLMTEQHYNYIINLINNISPKQFTLLGKIVNTDSTNYTLKSLTIPHNIFDYEVIVLLPNTNTIVNSNDTYKLQPFNIPITIQNQAYMSQYYLYMIKPFIGIMGLFEIYGYDDVSQSFTIAANGFTNTNVISFYTYQCDVSVYGNLA